MISLPRAFSSSRIRSASAQFFAFLASVRAATSASISGSALAALADFDQVMCLNLLPAAEQLRRKQEEENAANADPEIDALVQARTDAKKAKNFAEADRIRDELKARGVEIIDTPQGTKWRKV